MIFFPELNCIELAIRALQTFVCDFRSTCAVVLVWLLIQEIHL